MVELTDRAKQWLTKAREYWARADLLSGQAELDNLFFMLDADGDGAIGKTCSSCCFPTDFAQLFASGNRFGQFESWHSMTVVGFSEFRNGFGYLEERLSRMGNSAAPYQRRFTHATDHWSVLDVARWLEEQVGVGQVCSQSKSVLIRLTSSTFTEVVCWNR